MDRARYKFSAEKGFAAVQWMVRQGRPLDIHGALKSCYFADKSHLNEHLQPIFGATYRAMKFGPVPLEIYEILKGESMWLWEANLTATPWVLDGFYIRPNANTDPDLSVFGESELDHLRAGFEKSVSMTFTARTAATHGRDWQAANGGIMAYEDMIDPSERSDDYVRFIQETAPHVRL